MPKEKIPYKIYLEENEMPDYWYDMRAEMKNKPAPLLNPLVLASWQGLPRPWASK